MRKKTFQSDLYVAAPPTPPPLPPDEMFKSATPRLWEIPDYQKKQDEEQNNDRREQPTNNEGLHAFVSARAWRTPDAV